MRPLLASGAAIGISFATYQFCLFTYGESRLLTLLSLLLALLSYLIFSCLFGVVKKEELAIFPAGERLLKKLSWIGKMKKD